MFTVVQQSDNARTCCTRKKCVECPQQSRGLIALAAVWRVPEKCAAWAAWVVIVMPPLLTPGLGPFVFAILYVLLTHLHVFKHV